MHKSFVYKISLAYIAICFFISPICYLFCVDKTQYANTQTPRDALLNPMTKKCYEKKMERNDTDRNIVSKWMYGSQDIYRLLTNEDAVNECRIYFFGTDKYGRDLYSRIIIGIRYTIFVATIAVFFSIFLGVFFGTMAGYFGKKIDQIIGFMITVSWSLPTILLAFIILFAFGRSIYSICIAISLTMWADVARLIRGQVLSLKEQNYVTACIAMGYSPWRIMVQHILPNLMNIVLVAAAGNFALAVLLESGLSFLGLGLPAPIPTLGNIVFEQYPYIIAGKAWLSLIPSFVLVLLILSFQLITTGLRDKWDIRNKS